MKKCIMIFAICVMFLICGCSAPDHDIAQTEPQITSVTVEDFSPYYALLNNSAEERNWLYSSMGCLFSRPQEIDLYFMFYLGTGNGDWDSISEESRQYLLTKEFMYEMDLQVMPVEVLDQILQSTFGISISEVSIPTEWEYIEVEHAYCSNNNDAYFPSPFTITQITEFSDGTVEIFYTVDYFYDARNDHYYENPTLLLKLLKSENGSWRVISNIIV